MVFLLCLAVLMLLMKLMLKVLSMPKLHSINGVLDKHASTGCLSMQLHANRSTLPGWKGIHF